MDDWQLAADFELFDAVLSLVRTGIGATGVDRIVCVWTNCGGQCDQVSGERWQTIANCSAGVACGKEKCFVSV
jgi:hypothetical protein